MSRLAQEDPGADTERTPEPQPGKGCAESQSAAASWKWIWVPSQQGEADISGWNDGFCS